MKCSHIGLGAAPRPAAPLAFSSTAGRTTFDAPRVALAEGGSCSATGVGATMNLTVWDVETAAEREGIASAAALAETRRHQGQHHSLSHPSG